MERKEPHKQQKHRKTLRALLTRKSPKVEPKIVTDDNFEIENSTIAGSSLRQKGNLKNITFKNKPLLDENSVIASNSAGPPTNHYKTYNNNNNNNNNIYNNNRLSSQFKFCCSTTDNKSLTPPSHVESSNKPHENGSTGINLYPEIEITKTNSSENIVSSESIKESPPQEIFGERLRPLTVCEYSGTISSDEEKMKTYPVHPVFSEYQPSIAMQSCRSRLRDKLLPPGITQEIIDQNSQHFSSPNISADADQQREYRSNSFDNLTETSIIRRPAASTNSLVRQSLMAAHVLNLIPTEKVRERNFLQGRLAVTSLLGRSELERVLPSKEIRIFVGTWNMNGQNPPKQMNDFVLPSGIENVPDIITIGTQESCSERFEWEVILQETLGPTHILLHSTSLGTLHLAVFIHRDLIWFCSIPEDDCLSVRPGSAFRTKGAVAISFSLFGTSMLFVTSHLTAHQQKVKERVQDIKRITHALDLPRNLPIKHKNKDVTQNFDSVYWCGDLNFRLSEPRDKLLKWIENTKFPLPAHLPHGYMHTDQLTSVLSDGAAFKGFKEANITFPPTYKFDPGTQEFDSSSKQRAPAYTDRILFKHKQPSSALRRSSMAAAFFPQTIECISYDSVPSIITSDHKPVWGLFKNSIRSGIDSIPLAAGLFNRDVYIEGMRRRLNNTDASSTVCSIQ